jgi:hypothetical protein
MLPGRVIAFTEQNHPCSEIPQQSLTVILIGRDPELLNLRARVIAAAGYIVYSVSPEQAKAELQKARRPKLWIFCQTLDFYELALLALAIRDSSLEHKLLRLSGLDDIRQTPGLFHELLEPVTGVDDLLRAIGRHAGCS